MAAGGMAGGKTVAAQQGSWLCFEDEAGQTLRPAESPHLGSARSRLDPTSAVEPSP